LNAEIFQIVKLYNRDMYQVSVRELLGPYAMTHKFTSYLTRDLPEGWKETLKQIKQDFGNSSSQ